MTSFVNRAFFTVSNTPGTSGALTVSAAESGPFRTLGAAHDGLVFDVSIIDGSAWEVRRGCTYTHGSTSLSRGTLEESSTGSAINLTSAAKVIVTATAQRDTLVERLMRATTPGGRLTLTSGTPVTTSDVSGATTIYYTPYGHDTLVLWDGSNWTPTTFAETSHALGTVTSGANYDVFGYLSGGSLALEKLVWTNDTTRATAVTIQDGRYCKSGDKTRLYLGTFRTTSTTTTEDSAAKRFCWNTYNAVEKRLLVKDATATWTYNGTTFRQARANTANKVEIVAGLPRETVEVDVRAVCSGTGVAGQVGVGVSSTTVNSSDALGSQSAVATSGGTTYAQANTLLNHVPSAGYSYYAWLELSSSANTVTWYGSGTGAGYTAGMSGRWSA